MILNVFILCRPPSLGFRQEITWVMVQLWLSFLVSLVLDTLAILEALHQPVSDLLDPTHVAELVCEQFLISSAFLRGFILFYLTNFDGYFKFICLVNYILEFHGVVAHYPEGFPWLSRLHLFNVPRPLLGNQI